MNSWIQGILACSGNGGRFAGSVGGQSPYSKHLELVGDKTVLQRAVESMISCMLADGITIAVNPTLADLYMQEIQRLSVLYPEKQLSYVVSPVEGTKPGIESIRDNMQKGIYSPQGVRTQLHNPLVTYAHGDLFLDGDLTQLRDDTKTMWQWVEKREGKYAVISDVTGYGGSIYLLSRWHNLSAFGYSPYAALDRYGIRFFNINDVFELNQARTELGFAGKEDEPSIRFRSRNKEV